MIQIRKDMWIRPDDITFVHVTPDGKLVLDDVFVVEERFSIDVCTTFHINPPDIVSLMEQRKNASD